VKRSRLRLQINVYLRARSIKRTQMPERGAEIDKLSLALIMSGIIMSGIKKRPDPDIFTL
jgi:hypothetical protein